MYDPTAIVRDTVNMDSIRHRWIFTLLPVVWAAACGLAGCSRGPDEPLDAGTDAGADADGDTDAGADADQPSQLDPVQYVDPFIGTDDSDPPHPVPGGAGGSTYPGAVVPFGMVQLSPDTPTAIPSGYRYRDREIRQFSVTHFNGAGCPNNEDLPFLPFVGELTPSPGTIPGTDILVIHGPYFPSVTIRLVGGQRLLINGAGAGEGAPYIQSLSVDGRPTTRS